MRLATDVSKARVRARRNQRCAHLVASFYSPHLIAEVSRWATFLCCFGGAAWNWLLYEFADPNDR
jgi:hypothetical protein